MLILEKNNDYRFWLINQTLIHTLVYLVVLVMHLAPGVAAWDKLVHIARDRRNDAKHSYWRADVDAPPASAARRQCSLHGPLCGSVSRFRCASWHWRSQ